MTLVAPRADERCDALGINATQSDPRRASDDIVLRKGPRTWRFVWTESDVPDFIQTLGEMAENDDIDLDWFDAALVVYEYGRRLELLSQQTRPRAIPSEARP